MIIDADKKKSNPFDYNQLTTSEIEIVKLIAQGLTTKQIALQKYISFHTVMTHRRNILRKLGVSNASELIMYAVSSGLIDTIEYHI
jgi:DNA-binding NarL/FixJ family response regulator